MKNRANLLYPPDKTAKAEAKSLPKDFIEDLNLDMIAGMLYPGNSEYALRILTELCDDEETILYRQSVLRDFLNIPVLETVLLECINELYSYEYTDNKYKDATSLMDLGIKVKSLDAYIACINRCHEFAVEYMDQVESSGVRNLMSDLENIYQSADFKNLVKETAKLEEVIDHSVRSITIGINFDDYLRPTEMAVFSMSSDHFKDKPLLTKLFNIDSMDGKEYPISPVHKLMDVEANSPLDTALFNDMKELKNQLLNHFSIAVQSFYRINTKYLRDIESQLNFYVGAARMIKHLQAHGLKFCKPEIEKKEKRMIHIQDTVDLSFAAELMRSRWDMDLNTATVTNDINMDDGGRIFILTGPNHGGKTTYTRAAGICMVLFQAGLYVPGTSAEISPVDWIYTHFPKEEEVGLNTSRLTVECRQFKTTFKTATKYSLLLLNESISSTTPTECLNIASEIVKIMRYLGCRAIYTTHLLDLALNADKINSEIEGDGKIVSVVTGVNENAGDNPDGLNRSYKIKPGLPFQFSYASDIFHKYGIGFDEYVHSASNRSQKTGA